MIGSSIEFMGSYVQELYYTIATMCFYSFFMPWTWGGIAIIVFCFRFAPKPLESFHFTCLTPTALTLVFILLSTLWRHYAIPVSPFGWQQAVHTTMFFMIVLSGIAIIIAFRENWKFFLPIVLFQYYFTFMFSLRGHLAALHEHSTFP